MAVESERLQKEIDELKSRKPTTGIIDVGGSSQADIDKAVAMKEAELAQVRQSEAAAGQQAGGNTVTTERVKGDTLGLGSQLVQTVGLNQDAYASEAYDPIRQKAKEQEFAAGGRANKQIVVPAAQGTAAQIATGQQDQARGLQTELGNDLLAASRGQGPSVAGMQYQRNLEDAMAGQYSAAAGSRGNPAIAMRNAAANIGTMSQRGALDSAMIRAQEQQAAQGLLGNVATGMRGQDIGLATGQAELDQQMGMLNVGNQQQSNLAGSQMTQANEQFYRTLEAQYISAGMSAEEAAIAAKQRLSELGADLFVRQEGIKQGIAGAANSASGGVITTAVGGIAGGIGSGLGAMMGKK